MDIKSIKDFSIEDLQKLKLLEEINALKRPLWSQPQFISIVVTLIIAFTGTVLTIRQSEQAKVKLAESEQKRYQQMLKQLEAEQDILKGKKAEADMQYRTALSHMNEAIAEKSEVKNEKNSLQELLLKEREKDLRIEISKLEFVNKRLQTESNKYISEFSRVFVSEDFVQKDITRFAKEGMEQEMENWLIREFVFSSINRYHRYIKKEYEKILKTAAGN